MGELLQLSDRRPSDDSHTDVIVQYQQLADGFASPVSGAPAVRTTLAFAESETCGLHDGESRLIDQFSGWHVRLAALHANDPYEPLGEYTRQRGYETVRIY